MNAYAGLDCSPVIDKTVITRHWEEGRLFVGTVIRNMTDRGVYTVLDGSSAAL